jgi:hypothetical protein
MAFDSVDDVQTFINKHVATVLAEQAAGPDGPHNQRWIDAWKQKGAREQYEESFGTKTPGTVAADDALRVANKALTLSKWAVWIAVILVAILVLSGVVPIVVELLTFHHSP